MVMDLICDYPFFIIDPKNLGQVGSKVYGYWITEEGIFADMKTMPSKTEDLEGPWVFVNKSENMITITQDHIGCFGLFLFRKGDYWAISNSFNHLVDYIKQDHKLDFNKEFADTYLFQELCIPTYEETIIKQINLLDRRTVVKIDVEKKVLQVTFKIINEKYIPVDTKEGIETLDKWYYKWTSIIQKAVAMWPGQIIAEVSGGFDSRMVMALLLSAEIDKEKMCFSSWQHLKEDLRIAKKIAQSFGVELNEEQYPKTIIEEPQEKLLENTMTYTCFHKKNWRFATTFEVPRLTFDGAGGGMNRGYWSDISKEKYINDNKRRNPITMKGDVFNELSSSVGWFLDRCFESQRELYPDEREITGQTYYMETRNRIHFGMGKVKRMIRNCYDVSPLMDRILLRLKETGNKCNDPNLLPAIIYDRYCPRLLEFEFNGGRRIAPETVEYAKEINRLYPFKKAVAFGGAEEGEEFLNVDKKTRSNSIVSNDFVKTNDEIEIVIRKAFLSKALKNIFCKYYDEQVYEAIKWELAWLPRLRFWNWVACIGISKAILDTMTDGKNKTIADFVTECSGEVSDREYRDFMAELNKRKSIYKKAVDLYRRNAKPYRGLCIRDRAW